MKKALVIIILFASTIGFSQKYLSEEKKIEQFIYIWGLIKYQHPYVSKGQIDFNEEFINEFKNIEAINSQEALNIEFLNWINKFDSNKTVYKSNASLLNKKKSFNKNVNFNWIETKNFSSELKAVLIKLKNNFNIGNHYASVNSNSFVSFKNEKGLEYFDVTKKEHRILFLSSFWNIMNYWNVNLYLTDKPWSEVLIEMIPEFIENENVKFEYAKDKLFARLNDSHADYESSYFINKVLTKFPIFNGRIVNDSLVITSIRNTDLAKKDNIDLGDIIYSTEGKSLKNYYLEKFSNTISASTSNFLRSRIEKFFLFSSNNDSIQVGIRKKEGRLILKYIHLYDLKSYKYDGSSLMQTKNENWYKLNDNIGFINFKNITKSELNSAFETFENTKGIVIDLRNYPMAITQSDITSFLIPEKKVFVKVLGPSFPAYSEYDIKAALSIIKNPFVTAESKSYYKGKIILLVDRSTASNAEFMAMAIQQSPNCITIGEQTFGAILNRNRVPLLDNTTIDYTGMGAFYPNGEGVQRKGVKIDYLVNERAINYNPNLYIEDAIKIIMQ